MVRKAMALPMAPILVICVLRLIFWLSSLGARADADQLHGAFNASRAIDRCAPLLREMTGHQGSLKFRAEWRAAAPHADAAMEKGRDRWCVTCLSFSDAEIGDITIDPATGEIISAAQYPAVSGYPAKQIRESRAIDEARNWLRRLNIDRLDRWKPGEAPESVGDAWVVKMQGGYKQVTLSICKQDGRLWYIRLFPMKA